MTLDALLQTYNFHDCDAYTPFSIQNGEITVAFLLAKHLQYGDIRSKQDPLYADKKHNLIVRIRFLQCSDIRAIEWKLERCNARSKAYVKKYIEEIALDEFNWQRDFLSVGMSEEDGICFVFCDHGMGGSDLQFSCQDVDIEEEQLLDEVDCAALWDDE